MTADHAAVRAALEACAGEIRSARHVVALTGAGISVESGIPDFRSPGGVWTRFAPEEYATIEIFLAAPERAWRLYRELGRTLMGAEPNDAHFALAEMERRGNLRGVVTQNVDGLHQAAGSRRVIEVHGDHRTLQCLACGYQGALPDELLEEGPVPVCPDCGRALKPNVVLFGEAIREVEAIDELIAPCDLLVVIGTSAQVYPVAEYPHRVLRRGGVVLDLNLERTALRGRAGVHHVEGPATLTVRAFTDLVSTLREGGSSPP